MEVLAFVESSALKSLKKDTYKSCNDPKQGWKKAVNMN